MGQHSFTLKATWEGGFLGTGNLEARGLQTRISLPKEFNGPNVGTNPEEMLIGSAMNCYLVTLADILDRRQLKVTSLTLQSEGFVTVESGKYRFSQIIHRPTIVLGDGDKRTIETAQHAAHRAEAACMVSNTMRGNVEFTGEPTVRIGQGAS
ncbi:OsmC family protein [Brevibacillus dissolubilis]|uniref:OsmC family protein n=1 Tax=Brevibacillus dissolubilis TaxID=1844116 RepID=UPI0011168006|nr:OsmC family protein [Brevibacillus dissolubilis]